MARKKNHPKVGRVAPVRSPPQAKRPESRGALTLEDLRVALRALLHLADHCLTADQRGRSKATEREQATFWRVLDLMCNALDTLPEDGPLRGKTKTFSAEQFKLGDLREKLDSLCERAIRLQPSRRQDEQLATEATKACKGLFPEWGVTLDLALAAIAATKDRLGVDEDGGWLVLQPVWQGSKAKSNRPTHGAGAAGVLLEEIVARSGAKPRCGFKTSSTAKYAQTVREYDEVYRARGVTRNEELTLLAAALGAPLGEAAWTAFRIRLLLQGRDLADFVASPSTDDWDLRAPGEFKVPDRTHWENQVELFRRRLMAAGLVDDELMSRLAHQLSASHLRPAPVRPPRVYSGMKKKFGRGRNPWDGEQSAREAKRHVDHLIKVSPGDFEAFLRPEDVRYFLASAFPLDDPNQPMEAIHVLKVAPDQVEKLSKARETMDNEPRDPK